MMLIDNNDENDNDAEDDKIAKRSKLYTSYQVGFLVGFITKNQVWEIKEIVQVEVKRLILLPWSFIVHTWTTK